MAKRQRTHSEWFEILGRTSCPNCGKKKTKGHVYGWNEYVSGKKRLVRQANGDKAYFCENCFDRVVRQPLLSHVDGCGCLFVFKGYGGTVLTQQLIDLERELNSCDVKTEHINYIPEDETVGKLKAAMSLLREK